MKPIKLENFIRQSRQGIVPPPRIKAEVLAYARANGFRRPALFAMRYAVSLGAVLLFGTAGTVFASQQARPGQPLYGIKRASETAYVTIQPTPDAKAQVHELLIERRRSEAETAVDDDADQDNFAESIDSGLAEDEQLASDVADESDGWVDAQTQAFSLAVEREQ